MHIPDMMSSQMAQMILFFPATTCSGKQVRLKIILLLSFPEKMRFYIDNSKKGRDIRWWVEEKRRRFLRLISKNVWFGKKNSAKELGLESYKRK